MTCHCNHIGLFTNNPLQLIIFYSEKLGFEEGETKILSRKLMERIFRIPSSSTLTKLKLGQVTLEIISPQELNVKKRDNDVSGYNHWGLGVKKKEEFCQKLKEKGVQVIEVESSGRSIFFVKDPEGNLIEIYEAS